MEWASSLQVCAVSALLPLCDSSKTFIRGRGPNDWSNSQPACRFCPKQSDEKQKTGSSLEVCLYLLQVSLKRAFGTKCASGKKSFIQSESVSPLDDGATLAVLNLPPSIVMRETDLQRSLAGARRWRQGALDLWLSPAPVKEPLNCSTVWALSTSYHSGFCWVYTLPSNWPRPSFVATHWWFQGTYT